ncbi:MAG TPA: serine hydroxymethyltransferase [Terriglobia bacterium]|nr:serine hydroxymethyltransferase [Terriglobia bacterium]
MNRIDVPLRESDPEIHAALQGELRRQKDGLELIASENSTYRAVLEATGSVLTNKYAEGYPGRRYYGGCEFADVVEDLAITRAKELFGVEHANVQPHSGSQANMAVYLAALQPGDTVLGLNLTHGGHLTHGHSLNFSGKHYHFVPYGVNKDTETLDYAEIDRLAREHKPRMIVCGASAYPRTLDFERLGKTARETGAMLMADIAHIAGLVAAGEHPSPAPHAEFITSTTHKTLRGPRSGLVMCREVFARDVNRAVFPEMQGGPLVHVIAAKAVCFKEASREEFRAYIRQTLKNARVLAARIASRGFRIVSGGTDTHLMLVDVFSKGINGKQAEQALERAGITVNKNAIPFDTNPPMTPSGVRVGTPALTTRGMKEGEMEAIGDWIAAVLDRITDEALQQRVRKEVEALCEKFPLYSGM